MEVGPLGWTFRPHPRHAPPRKSHHPAGSLEGWLQPGKGERGRLPKSGAVAVTTDVLATERPARVNREGETGRRTWMEKPHKQGLATGTRLSGARIRGPPSPQPSDSASGSTTEKRRPPSSLERPPKGCGGPVSQGVRYRTADRPAPPLGESPEGVLGSRWVGSLFSLPGRRGLSSPGDCGSRPQGRAGPGCEGPCLFSQGSPRHPADGGPRRQDPVTVPCCELGFWGPLRPFGTVSWPSREVGGGQRRARPSEGRARGPFLRVWKGDGALPRPWV